MRELHVILDNGHGNDTVGKRSPVWSDGTQLLEWEFNRNIVNRIQQILPRDGVTSTRLVPELFDISITDRIVRANRIIAASNKDGCQCLLISVHGNAGKGTGFEVFTSIGKTRSDIVAQLFCDHAPEYLKGFPVRTDLRDGDGDKESDGISLLPKSHCPAVLTENLFMDRQRDCYYMQSESGRQAIAEMHVRVIREYRKGTQ